MKSFFFILLYATTISAEPDNKFFSYSIMSSADLSPQVFLGTERWYWSWACNSYLENVVSLFRGLPLSPGATGIKHGGKPSNWRDRKGQPISGNNGSLKLHPALKRCLLLDYDLA